MSYPRLLRTYKRTGKRRLFAKSQHLTGRILLRTGTNTQEGDYQLVLGRKIPKLLILNDISSISQDEDLFDTVFRWPKSAKNGIFDEFSQNLRFLKIGEYH